MFDHVDPTLLVAGLARVAVWAAIAVIGYQQRRLLPLMFGSLAALTSVVFAINNARGEVPRIAIDISTFLALPIAVMILMGVMVTAPVLMAPKSRKWRL